MTRPGDWTPGTGAEADPALDLDFDRDDSDVRDAGQDRAARLKKSPSAFRTISEVADDLHIPQHVLRFWETRFPQVKPLKRGGGRRYYRPDDIGLLRRISDLLYIQGYTIKGVQRLLREGDGTLSGELPPPDVADRGDDHEPGAQPHRSAQLPADEDDTISDAAEPWIPMAPPAAVHAEVDALKDEIRRLQEMLDLVLGGLVDLRQSLPL
ncbi:MAG: MerR family transcriptional regulator [Janthinobacterium lividum]